MHEEASLPVFKSPWKLRLYRAPEFLWIRVRELFVAWNYDIIVKASEHRP
jgi:hypothetical protein